MPEHLRSGVQSNTPLADLIINPIDRYYSLPQALDEAFGIELSDEEVTGWHTVRDVERSVILRETPHRRSGRDQIGSASVVD